MPAAAQAPAAEPAGMQDLARIVEALLFLSPEPVSLDALADACEAPEDEVVEALHRLREHYAEGYRGVVLREVAGGFTLATDPVAEQAARRLLAKPRTPPLTQAQAECLGIVAYLQPVSRPEIARIRGVASESAVGTLLERGLIEESRPLAVRRRPLPHHRPVPEAVRPRGARRAARHRPVRPVAGGGGGAARAPAEGGRAASAERRVASWRGSRPRGVPPARERPMTPPGDASRRSGRPAGRRRRGCRARASAAPCRHAAAARASSGRPRSPRGRNPRTASRSGCTGSG